MAQVVQVEALGRGAVRSLIRAGQSLSEPADLGGYDLVAVQMPPAWTAANLTFQAAEKDGGTYQDVYDDAGGLIVVQVAASRCVVVGGTASASLRGLRFLKARSGTPSVPVAQAEDRSLLVLIRQGA